MVIKVSKYKDQCDICHSYKYCKGFDKKVLCEECRAKQLNISLDKTRNNKKKHKKQLNIFDLI